MRGLRRMGYDDEGEAGRGEDRPHRVDDSCSIHCPPQNSVSPILRSKTRGTLISFADPHDQATRRARSERNVLAMGMQEQEGCAVEADSRAFRS